jgi:hypothetical protein
LKLLRLSRLLQRIVHAHQVLAGILEVDQRRIRLFAQYSVTGNEVFFGLTESQLTNQRAAQLDLRDSHVHMIGGECIGENLNGFPVILLQVNMSLQVNITSFVVQSGPILINGNYESIYSFLSTNSLIAGGTTQTSQSTITPYKLGGASLAGGPTAATEFTMTVGANNNAISNDSWIVTLTSTTNLIPSGILPQPAVFPPASAWVVPAEPAIDTAFLTVYVGGKCTDYQITAIGACSARGRPASRRTRGPKSTARVWSRRPPVRAASFGIPLLRFSKG